MVPAIERTEPDPTPSVRVASMAASEEAFQRKVQESVPRADFAGLDLKQSVETTVRTAGNLGYDTYVVADACATSNRVGWDGIDRDAELVHAMAITSMDGEFCTALKTTDALRLLDGDAPDLVRRQGNE